jgi:hypothetical protein
MTLKSLFCALGTALTIMALVPGGALAQSCPTPFTCDLLVSCFGLTCSINEEATFTLVCDRLVLEPCPEIEEELCCEVDIDVPSTAYYEGERLVNGQWEVDANCVSATNPLEYTFVSGDEGKYRRSACKDSSCLLCSPTKTITVE